jgi:leucine dehydrogenase
MKAPVKSSGSSSRAGSTPSETAPRERHLDELFALIGAHDTEQVSLWHDPRAGYRGIIAIHSTVLGPALGGTRMWPYESDQAALVDVLRLARGMTYKAAVAGLNLGGGKSVIIADPRVSKREAIFRAHGRHVSSLGGRYITAEDVGTTPTDMEYIHRETPHVVGLSGRSGDPSPLTALGVYRGMKACAKVVYGSDALAGKTVAVQGCGKVGYYLCGHLKEEGARLVVTDIDQQKVTRAVREFGAAAVGPNEIYAVAADIFAPCALGAVVNDDTLEVLKARIVAGGANNQLAEDRHGDALHQRGVVYAPDYAINSGGVISVSAEVEGWDAERSRRQASAIYDTILKVLHIAEEEKIPTYRAAERLAEQRIAAALARNGKLQGGKR